jgi:hypothetical protein
MAERDLYVHVADDGGLLVIEGGSGKSSWVTEPELRARVAAARDAGGGVVVSAEQGTPLSVAALEAIRATGVRVVPATQVHPDAVRPPGVTSLMAAAYVGAAHLVEDLLRRGADVEAQDELGYSALMYAANASHSDLVGRLVEAGAPLDQRDRQGSTPLMFAASQGDLRSVRKLLAAGSDPHLRRTADALSAFDIAQANGHEKVASVLLSVGAG